MVIKLNPKKHSVFDVLTYEYSYFDEDFLKEERQFSELDINDLKRGLRMEKQGWGFLEHKNCILYREKQSDLMKRTYFIVGPYEQILSTEDIFNITLKFEDSHSILLADAGNYFGICKKFLDEALLKEPEVSKSPQSSTPSHLPPKQQP
ncbi:MAG: hypothetical protein ABH811_02600 [archaeon]